MRLNKGLIKLLRHTILRWQTLVQIDARLKVKKGKELIANHIHGDVIHDGEANHFKKGRE